MAHRCTSCNPFTLCNQDNYIIVKAWKKIIRSKSLNLILEFFLAITNELDIALTPSPEAYILDVLMSHYSYAEMQSDQSCNNLHDLRSLAVYNNNNTCTN